MTDIVESKAKCPKCKSITLNLTEVWRNHTITWNQVDGKFDRQDGVMENGDAYKVYAECCYCNHSWIIRGALQITDIIKS